METFNNWLRIMSFWVPIPVHSATLIALLGSYKTLPAIACWVLRGVAETLRGLFPQ